MGLREARTLRFGPYSPPRISPGEEIQCEMRGLIIMHSWSDRGEIMWPLGIRGGISPGRPAMVLTGDLVRAVRREAAAAVAKHWGTTWRTVRVWRRALGVDRMTEGSTEVARENGNMDIAAVAEKGNAASLAPESRKRRDAAHASAMRGRIPVGPLLAYRRRRKELVMAIIDHALSNGSRVSAERLKLRAEILTAYFADSMTMEQIGERLGMTKQAIHSVIDSANYRVPPELVRAVKRLRAKLREEHIYVPAPPMAQPKPCPKCGVMCPSGQKAKSHCAA